MSLCKICKFSEEKHVGFIHNFEECPIEARKERELLTPKDGNFCKNCLYRKEVHIDYAIKDGSYKNKITINCKFVPLI